MNEVSDSCIVCGAPNGTCLGERTTYHVIGANMFPSLGHKDVFIVPHDVYVDVPILSDGSETPLSTRRRVLKAGQVIFEDEARKYGLLKT